MSFNIGNLPPFAVSGLLCVTAIATTHVTGVTLFECCYTDVAPNYEDQCFTITAPSSGGGAIQYLL